MTFSSIDFLIFFSLVLAGTAFIERFFKQRVKEIFLLLASFFFYGYWDYRFCFLLLFVIVVSYISAQHADKKPAFVAGILVPLSVLGIFKYLGFFMDTFEAMIGRDLGTLRIILPVGISFYTFQALSYVIDVKRGKIPVEKDFIKLALYVSFFPQLVAGPIVRASEFLPQLREKRCVNWQNLQWGFQVFAFGLFKKIVLADHMSVFVDDVYSKPAAFSAFSLFFATITYTVQIYFDFSGYSDMAIGCAKCLGYDFSRNFNIPYMSRSISELWRRWHISLSTWLKEYVYIPLGGNRKGLYRQCLNLFLTMLVGGLWHGAAWKYVFWGGLHGIMLCVDKFVPRKSENEVVRALNIVDVFLFNSLSFIFFRSEKFSDAILIIKRIVTFQKGINQPFAWSFIGFAVLIIASIVADRKAKKENRPVSGFYPILDLSTVKGMTLFFIELGLILTLAYTGENPFVYFQF